MDLLGKWIATDVIVCAFSGFLTVFFARAPKIESWILDCIEFLFLLLFGVSLFALPVLLLVSLWIR